MTVRILVLCGALILVCSGCAKIRAKHLDKWVYKPIVEEELKRKKRIEPLNAPGGNPVSPSNRITPPLVDSDRAID